MVSIENIFWSGRETPAWEPSGVFRRGLPLRLYTLSGSSAGIPLTLTKHAECLTLSKRADRFAHLRQAEGLWDEGGLRHIDAEIFKLFA